jgi:hypothetical protein
MLSLSSQFGGKIQWRSKFSLEWCVDDAQGQSFLGQVLLSECTQCQEDLYQLGRRLSIMSENAMRTIL